MNKVSFPLYLTKELKKQLENEAKEKCLSLNSYIRMIISERSK